MTTTELFTKLLNEGQGNHQAFSDYLKNISLEVDDKVTLNNRLINEETIESENFNMM